MSYYFVFSPNTSHNLSPPSTQEIELKKKIEYGTSQLSNFKSLGV